MPSFPQSTLEDIVGEIQALLPSYASLIEDYKKHVQQHPDQQLSLEQRSDSYWKKICFHDSLIRVRLLIEQNSRCIETIALLGTARYLFEVVVWIKLMRNEPRYGLVYYRNWVETNRKLNAGFLEPWRRTTVHDRRHQEAIACRPQQRR